MQPLETYVQNLQSTHCTSPGTGLVFLGAWGTFVMLMMNWPSTWVFYSTVKVRGPFDWACQCGPIVRNSILLSSSILLLVIYTFSRFRETCRIFSCTTWSSILPNLQSLDATSHISWANPTGIWLSCIFMSRPYPINYNLTLSF